MADTRTASRDLVADKLAIGQLLERYADAVTHRDADQWRSTWSEISAQWLIRGSAIEGIDAIVEGWTERLAQFDAVEFRMLIGAIDVAGDRATALSSTVEVFWRDGQRGDEVHGRYDDVLRREAGGWRFVRRSFSTASRPIGRDHLDAK